MLAFAIIGVMAVKKTGLGWMLVPAIFVLGFTLIFSLVVSKTVKPLHDLTIDAGKLVASICLSILFLILAAVYLGKLKLGMETFAR